VTSGGNNFNDIPDNQLNKFRVFIGWSRIFIPLPLKFLWSIAVRSPNRTDANDRHNGQRQTNGRTKRRVTLSVRPASEMTYIQVYCVGWGVELYSLTCLSARLFVGTLDGVLRW